MDDDQHIADELIDLALGHAAGGTEAAAGHLRRCARCRAELAACRETLAALALAQPPVAPASSVRRRLLESLAASPAWPWSIALARLFDVTVARAHSLWSGLAAPSAWIATPLPGFAIAHAEGGDGTRGAYTGFAKMAAGCASRRTGTSAPSRC